MQDVVLFNEADDDGFMDCTAKDITFENMTMLQLGGYDGIVQVGCGCLDSGWPPHRTAMCSPPKAKESKKSHILIFEF
jgi:hypothetical protein